MIQADLIIIGAGAAGLAAAIFAGEAAAGTGRRIGLLEGAQKLGAKILASGGGRCNATHERVTPEDYWGGPRPMIRAVLRAFDERSTADWMARIGAPLKVEPTGKLFPVGDKARTVLDALEQRVAETGAELRTGARVAEVRAIEGGGFDIDLSGGERFHGRRLILATGGLALPASGSDGAGLELARRLGHTIVPTTPALSPLVLRAGPTPGGCFAELSGLTVDARLGLYEMSGRAVEERLGSLVFTHFGVSGPAALDLSRHIFRFRLERSGQAHEVCLGHPEFKTIEQADAWLRGQTRLRPRASAAAAIAGLWPDRLARVLGEGLGDLAHLAREQRLALARRLARLPLEVVGDRGWALAEATAGGVDLREIDPRTMQSRRAPGLYLCGEMLDVDGRLGGFNFQWAWSSGHQAGRAAAAAP